MATKIASTGPSPVASPTTFSPEGGCDDRAPWHAGRARARSDLERLQRVALGRLAHLLGGDRLEVERGDLLLLVGDLLEPLERLVQRVALDLEAELGERVAQRVAPGVLSENDRVRLQADLARVHDLVGGALLEHAVLVDAGLVGEGVSADDGLVRLHRISGEPRDHPAGTCLLARPSPVPRPCTSRRVFSGITISSSEQFPARSPIPFIAHSTCGRPPEPRRRSWRPPSRGHRGNGPRSHPGQGRGPARRGGGSRRRTPPASCSRPCPEC